MIRAFLAALVGSALAVGSAAAQNCAGSFPNTLTNGTNADATQVMADLTYLLNCINSLPATSTAWTQIASHTVSGTEATISFTGISANEILVVINGLTNDTSAASMSMAVSIDNGSTYGASRSTSLVINTAATYGSFVVFGVKIGWLSTRTGSTTTTAPGINSGTSSNLNTPYAMWNTNAAVNAIRFATGGNNFNGGTMTLYGR